MNSEAPSSAPPEPRSKGALAVDVLKATYIPLMFGMACLVGLVALWYYGVPWRGVALVTAVVCIAGPFAASYSALFVHLLNKRAMIPVVLVDEDMVQYGLVYLSRSEFGRSEVEGGELGYRHSSTGLVYIAEDYRLEQRERVNPDTGEKENYAQPVLEASWEGDFDLHAFIEKKETLKAQRKKLVPLAKQGVQARASADMKVLENSDKAAHAALLGAEEDTFFDLGNDPLDYDLDVGLEDLEPKNGAHDSDDSRDEKPEPGSFDLQPGSDNPEVEADD